MAYKSFEELEVWKRGCHLAVRVYEVLKECRDFALKDQMTRVAVSISSNIALCCLEKISLLFLSDIVLFYLSLLFALLFHFDLNRLFLGRDYRVVPDFSLSPWIRDVGQDISHRTLLFDFIGRNAKIYLDKDAELLQ